MTWVDWVAVVAVTVTVSGLFMGAVLLVAIKVTRRMLGPMAMFGMTGNAKSKVRVKDAA